jgi:hypothetical protein
MSIRWSSDDNKIPCVAHGGVSSHIGNYRCVKLREGNLCQARSNSPNFSAIDLKSLSAI